MLFQAFSEFYPDIASKAAEVLGDQAPHWMAAPNPALGGLMPYEAHEKDSKMVVNMLMRVQHGHW
ncbi:MAG: MbcA/ParS/Xre antitoxin family protein [Candidatus Thiodiazotropha sp. (ex Monitilora ramsayi)]|nr:MbcA/ParS/Xre antitoxin family protein [Candidatus Thiodiazotropha sp. (ex Monitilora ramsayi)]